MTLSYIAFLHGYYTLEKIRTDLLNFPSIYVSHYIVDHAIRILEL